MTDDIARVDSRDAAKRYAILAYGSFGTMFDVGCSTPSTRSPTPRSGASGS